jgi:ribosomal protein S18 acetylase RimI-like enzyme
MTKRNKTLNINCRFLTEADFPELHQTFLEAFSDYFVPFQLSEEQLKNHIRQNSVELERCVGAFFEDKMVGVTLNGFGLWDGKKTVYDAGTGVIPAFRNQGIGKAIFDFMTPIFQQNGFQQILLEVISQNKMAIRLYEKLGFKQTRRLLYFEQKTPFEFTPENKFEIREISAPDWELFESFLDGKPSWQNSLESIKRSIRKVILGAFFEEKCIGYGVVYQNSGIIAQIAIAKKFRREGVASMILGEMQKRLGENKNLRASNVDESFTDAVEFLRQCGFIETLSQLEMIKTLHPIESARAG